MEKLEKKNVFKANLCENWQKSFQTSGCHGNGLTLERLGGLNRLLIGFLT